MARVRQKVTKKTTKRKVTFKKKSNKCPTCGRKR